MERGGSNRPPVVPTGRPDGGPAQPGTTSLNGRRRHSADGLVSYPVLDSTGERTSMNGESLGPNGTSQRQSRDGGPPSRRETAKRSSRDGGLPNLAPVNVTMNRAPSSREGQRSRKPSEDGAGLTQRKPSDDGRDIWQEAVSRAKRTGPGISAKAPQTKPRGVANGVVPMDTAEIEAETPNYAANPYFGKDVESQAAPADDKVAQGLLGYRFKRQRAINWIGCILFLYFCGAGLYYLYIRITKTLDLGPLYTWYGIVLLVVECCGASTCVIYGINLLFNPVHEPCVDDERQPGSPKVALPYHIRVLIACYKEDLECIKRTIKAAHSATLPYGCRRTIYLCDDGKDPEKRAWIHSRGPEFVYVSGRKRAKGEMNGKSGNVNNLCNQLYPAGVTVPGNEVLCIFDADQMAKKQFFLRTVPLLDGGDDVAMVLSPQCFHNMNLHVDIFNHSNIHFWEYMQTGYDAIGFISCTGTNFLIRANAFQKVGWSPTYTLTEDFALGMELMKERLHCRYVQEYIAVGEGHFQIMFNPKVCPLLQSKLGIGWRIMYCSGVWSYVVGGVSTPFFIGLPLVTIWIGVFPIVISRELALALTIYGVANYLLLYYVRSPSHLESLWFANVANQLLWWAYWKACWRALYTRVCSCCASITFKATAKGKGKLKNNALGDLWLHFITVTLLVASIGVGIWQLVTGSAIISPLLISVLWAVHAAIPPSLLLYYSLIGHGIFFQLLCKFLMFASFAAAASAIGLMWAIQNYNSKEFSGGQLFANKNIGVLFRYIHKGFNKLG